MEINEMTMEELEARKAAIAAEVDAEGADLDALENEVRAINDEIEKRKAEEARKAQARNIVAMGKGTPLAGLDPADGGTKMTNEEVRNSIAYVNAFADFIKTGDDKECRSLLTENVSGVVPVPEMIDEIVRTAWDNDTLLSRVRKTAIRGNLKVAYEISATGAVEHTEGTDAPTEETLVLGIVTMIPKNVKKWITISDEVVAMGGEAFLRYVYDELTHQIVKKLSELVVADIIALPETATSTSPAAAKITAAPGLTTVPTAFANLSDEAAEPAIVMNKLTYAEFISAQAAGNFAFDPFMGLPVVFANSLPAYSAASSGAVYMFVGDLSGAQVNYPEGEGVVLKYDDLSLAETDMVKLVGRQYAAHAVTASGRFTLVAKS